MKINHYKKYKKTIKKWREKNPEILAAQKRRALERQKNWAAAIFEKAHAEKMKIYNEAHNRYK